MQYCELPANVGANPAHVNTDCGEPKTKTWENINSSNLEQSLHVIMAEHKCSENVARGMKTCAFCSKYYW